MSESAIDTEAVRALADLLDETGLTEIEYESGDLRVRVARTAAGAVATPAVMPAPGAAPPAGAPASAPVDEHPGAITSPMVGVVYLAPEPGATNFVKVGDTVEEGATLLLIEAMKTFNPVRAPRAGRVTALLVGDSTPVEYGEPLVVIEA